jgi:hypothetical protein
LETEALSSGGAFQPRNVPYTKLSRWQSARIYIKNTGLALVSVTTGHLVLGKRERVELSLGVEYTPFVDNRNRIKNIHQFIIQTLNKEHYIAHLDNCCSISMVVYRRLSA